MRKKKDKYHYFVSYYCKKNGSSGFGCTEVIMNNKITNYDMVQDMIKLIKNTFGSEQVVLINYILIGVNLENEKSSSSC